MRGFGRIEFDGNVIDLPRPWTSFQPRRPISEAPVQAASGKEQTLSLFSQWFINARLNLTDPQIARQFQRLFEYGENGATFTVIRDRDIGLYLNFEGGINPAAAPRGLKSHDDVDGTFTITGADDAAYYLDEATGLLKIAGAAGTDDVPRFEAGKYGSALRIDGAAVNLITHPSVFDNAAWSKVSMTIGANTTETLDPAGTNIADKMTATGAAGIASFASSTAIGNEVTAGVWLKCPSGTVAVTLVLSGTGGGSDTKAITVTTEWQRFFIQKDSSGYTTFLQFGISIDDNTEIIYGYGAGLYDDFEFDPGTIGAASTAAITRAAEKLTFPSINVINKEKFSVFMWVHPDFDPIAPDGLFHMLFNSGDAGGAAADSHARFYYDRDAGDRLVLEVNGDGGATKRIDYTPGVATGLTQGNKHHVGFTVDSTVANGGHIYVDGAELASGSTNSAFNISETGDVFGIGSDLQSTIRWYGLIDEVLIIKNVLTSREIADLNGMGEGLGVPRNRWTVRLADPTWNPEWLQSDIYDIPLLFKEVLT